MSVLFHVSDLHFGREDPAALSWFADAVAREQPDAVVVTGDLTMRARSHEFEAAKAWLAALKRPITLEVGNHDLPYFNPLRRLFTPYRRFKRVERAIERPIELADARLVPLKTTARAQMRLNWASGRVSRSGLAAALTALAETPPEIAAIVTCHHPLFTVANDRGEITARGSAALKALAAAGADMVLSGHIHDPFDRICHYGDHSIRMIGAGTLSTRVRQTRPSFNRIDISPEGMIVSARKMEN
jgi:3',5'-cyclic AMP phosphodiesterase CpdA